MSQLEIFFNHLEARLRLLIEGDAAHDGFPAKLHRQLTRGLNRAMRNGARLVAYRNPSAKPALTAPDQYTLVLPAIEAQVLLTHPSELDRLTQKLVSNAGESGIAFVVPPLLRVVADPQCTSPTILTEFSQPGVDDSNTYQLEGTREDRSLPPTVILPNAFLIVNGLSIFCINVPVINIGRDPASHLRLNDPQISQQHAQLRFIQGRFIIFDLDSLGGTFVNGVPISSHTLKPGDVIQLGHMPLVFGLEDAKAAGQTQELSPDPPAPEML